MRIISMEEFVEKVAMKGISCFVFHLYVFSFFLNLCPAFMQGRLKIPVPSRFSDAKSLIGRPGSAHWDNSNSIYKYLEQACFTQKWNPYRTFVGMH